MYERKYENQLIKNQNLINSKFLIPKNKQTIQQRNYFLFPKKNSCIIQTNKISLNVFSKNTKNLKRFNSHSFINKTPTNSSRINKVNKVITNKISVKKIDKILCTNSKSKIYSIICDLKDEITKTKETNNFKLQKRKNNSYSNLNNKNNNLYTMGGSKYVNTFENKIMKKYSSVNLWNKNSTSPNKTENCLFNNIKNLAIDNNNINFHQINKLSFDSLSNKRRFNYIYNPNEKFTTLNNFNKKQFSPSSIFTNYKFSKENNQINNKTEYLRDIMINMEKQKKSLTRLYYNNDIKTRIRNKNFYNTNHIKNGNKKLLNFSDINNKLVVLNSQSNIEKDDDSIDIKSIDDSSILGESLKKRN